MRSSARAWALLLLVVLASGCGDDFQDSATAACEEAYQKQVGAEFPDRTAKGREAFVRGCVQAEEQKRDELGPDYKPQP